MEEVCRRAAGEKRARPRCLGGGQVSRFEAWGSMSHAENPAMNGNQRAFGQPLPDFLRGDASVEQLGTGHNSMGPGRQLSEFPVDRADLLFHRNT